MKFTHKISRNLIKLLFVGVFFSLWISPAQAAGSATFSISPSSGSYNIGDYINLTIRENSGTTGINAVDVKLDFNSGQLLYDSSTVSGSFADLGLTRTPKAGQVNLVVWKPGTTISGDQIVGTVKFKVLAAGTANLTFAGSSSIVSQATAQNIWNGQTAAGSFSLRSVTPGATPTPTKIIPGTSATPTAKSSAPTTAGTSGKASTSSPPSTKSSTSTTSGSQQAVQGASSAGYMVAIKVVDANNKILVGIEVSIDDKYTAISDSTGIASFLNLPAGKHTVKTVVNGKTNSQIIEVKGESSTIPQEFTMPTAPKKSSIINYIYGGIALGLIILIIVIVLVLRKRRRDIDSSSHGVPSNYNMSSTIDVPSNPAIIYGNAVDGIPATGTVIRPSEVSSNVQIPPNDLPNQGNH